MTNKPEQSFGSKVAIVVIGAFLSALGAWVWQISEDRQDLTILITTMQSVKEDVAKLVTDRDVVVQLQTQQIAMNEALQNVMQWQEEWPRTGMLQADVQQDANIEFLREQLAAANSRIAQLEMAVTDLRISGNRSPL